MTKNGSFQTATGHVASLCVEESRPKAIQTTGLVVLPSFCHMSFAFQKSRIYSREHLHSVDGTLSFLSLKTFTVFLKPQKIKSTKICLSP